MIKNITILLVFFGIIFGCSTKIKSINEYQKQDNTYVLKKTTNFDKNGNIILVEDFGNPRSIRRIETHYRNNRKIRESTCDFFTKQDTCVIRSFSKFEFDESNKIEKQILFENDSTIRLIREITNKNNIQIKKTYSWEFFPTKNPVLESAIILSDTTYFDDSSRRIKVVHYNSNTNKPWIESIKHSQNEYSVQTIGTLNDTIIKYKILPLQKIAIKNKLDFTFYDYADYKYEIKKF